MLWQNWTKPQIFISECLCWACESCSGHALCEDAHLDNWAWYIFVILPRNPLKSQPYPEIFHDSYMQSKLLVENWPRLIFCSDFLKLIKRKRQDFILWPIIELFLYLVFIFLTYFYLAIMDANQLAKIFAWEYYWMLRLRGKEFLTHTCLCTHEEALPPLWVITSHTRHSFCVKASFETVKKMKVQTFMSLKKVKISHFTWWDQWRKNLHCHIINTVAITVFHSKSPKPRKLPSLWNSLCLFQREGSLTSYPRSGVEMQTTERCGPPVILLRLFALEKKMLHLFSYGISI